MTLAARHHAFHEPAQQGLFVIPKPLGTWQRPDYGRPWREGAGHGLGRHSLTFGGPILWR